MPVCGSLSLHMCQMWVCEMWDVRAVNSVQFIDFQFKHGLFYDLYLWLRILQTT